MALFKKCKPLLRDVRIATGCPIAQELFIARG